MPLTKDICSDLESVLDFLFSFELKILNWKNTLFEYIWIHLYFHCLILFENDCGHWPMAMYHFTAHVWYVLLFCTFLYFFVLFVLFCIFCILCIFLYFFVFLENDCGHWPMAMYHSTAHISYVLLLIYFSYLIFLL